MNKDSANRTRFFTRFAQLSHLRLIGAGGSRQYHLASSVAGLNPEEGLCCELMADVLRNQNWLPAVPYFAKLVDRGPVPAAVDPRLLPPANTIVVINQQRLDNPVPGLHLHTPGIPYWLPSECFELDLHFSPN